MQDATFAAAYFVAGMFTAGCVFIAILIAKQEPDEARPVRRIDHGGTFDYGRRLQ